MIRTIEDILGQLGVEVTTDNLKKLKNWGDSIVDECAGNFECTMEEVDNEEYEGYLDMDGNQVYPVLVRSTIIDVKSKIVL